MNAIDTTAIRIVVQKIPRHNQRLSRPIKKSGLNLELPQAANDVVAKLSITALPAGSWLARSWPPKSVTGSDHNLLKELIMAKRKSTSTKRRSRQFVRPEFKPAWTKEEAISAANMNLAPDHVSAVGLRLASVVLAQTPEELIRGALAEGDGESPAETVVKLLEETESCYKARMEILEAAKARVLLTACYAYGVSPSRPQK